MEEAVRAVTDSISLKTEKVLCKLKKVESFCAHGKAVELVYEVERKRRGDA